MDMVKICFFIILFMIGVPEGLWADSLAESIQNNDTKAVRKFLKQNPQLIKESDSNGNLPIHNTAELCNRPITELLIHAGSDINAWDEYDRTPLFKAVKNCPTEFIQWMIEKGADVKAKTTEDHWTPIHAAVTRRDNESVVELLLHKGADINAKTLYHETTPLTWAIRNGNESMAQFLIQKGADVNSGFPLLEAIEMKKKELVAYLIEKGAEVNLTNPRSYPTPLQKAAHKGDLGIVKLMVEKGAQINSEETGLTALGVAASSGHEEIVQFLIDQGAHIMPSSSKHTSPLYLAAVGGHLKVVKLLIQQGANVNTSEPINASTALSSSLWGGHKEVAEYLVSQGAQPNLFDLAMLGDVEELKSFPKIKESINDKDYLGNTLLHAASRHGQTETVKFLIDLGADVNAKTDGVEDTPLHYAVQWGQIEVAQLLIEKGADINAKRAMSLYWQSGYTPLHSAVEKGDKAMVEILIQNGADVNVKNGYNASALSMAVEMNQQEIAELFKKAGAKNGFEY